MSKEQDEEGIINALLVRFTKERLPRALEIKERVDAGGKLESYDIDFLETVFNDIEKIKPLADRHPEYQEIAAKGFSIYTELMKRASENE